MRFSTTTIPQAVVAGLIAFCTVLPSAARDSDGDAVAVVDNLHAALLEIMQNAKTLGYIGRRERIAPVIERSFDLPFITQFTLGRYWSDLSAEQQKTAVETFSRWTIANYAARFNGYSGEQFETISNESARRDRELVRTVLEVKTDPREQITLDYLLHETDDEWRIVNVIANGVSDLSLKRADYGAVVKSGGLDTLIAKLNGQIQELETKN